MTILEGDLCLLEFLLLCIGRAVDLTIWDHQFTPIMFLLLLLFVPTPHLPQVSKLTTLLLRSCRSAAGASSWDPLVPGTAIGKLVELHELDPAVLAGFKEPVVVLLKQASGDEEVAASGRMLKGVVLAQELPHLSHLGERATVCT